ncbi:MAG: flagellar hook-associated protein FlgL [Pseudomonadales bacterium]|nr:flagellar hook-associated protein FlgL [Pseudomonadales bacterium]
MRISTQAMFDQSIASLNQRQGDLIKTGNQIATGRRVVNPSDDPRAASQAVGLTQTRAALEQFSAARVSTRNSLSQEESILNSVSDGITRSRTLILQASSGSLSDPDRVSLASELRGIRETLIGQANATDGNGSYLFGGFQDGSPPFVKDASGAVVYVGDANIREQRIDASRLMPVTDHGQSIFQSVQTGAGYVAEANAANTGNLTFVGPKIIDTSDPDFGSLFTLDFTVTGADTSYSVNGGPAQPYVPGEPVTFGGLSLTLDGVPADGDSIQTGPGAQMNTDLFATLDKAIAALENPRIDDSDTAALQNTLSTVLRELDRSLDNVLTIRASVGARLNELDTVDIVSNNRVLSTEQTISELLDLDLVKAISDFTLRQVGLEAAQKTFTNITGLSLFELL